MRFPWENRSRVALLLAAVLSYRGTVDWRAAKEKFIVLLEIQWSEKEKAVHMERCIWPLGSTKLQAQYSWLLQHPRLGGETVCLVVQNNEQFETLLSRCSFDFVLALRCLRVWVRDHPSLAMFITATALETYTEPLSPNGSSMGQHDQIQTFMQTPSISEDPWKILHTGSLQPRHCATASIRESLDDLNETACREYNRLRRLSHRSIFPAHVPTTESLFQSLRKQLSWLQPYVLGTESPQLVVCAKQSAILRGAVSGAWHRDIYERTPEKPQRHPDYISVVLAVTAVTAANGPVEFVPDADRSDRWSSHVNTDFLDGHRKCLWTGASGDFVLFDARMWHRAAAMVTSLLSDSDPPRVVLQFIIHRKKLKINYSEELSDGAVSLKRSAGDPELKLCPQPRVFK